MQKTAQQTMVTEQAQTPQVQAPASSEEQVEL